MSAKQPVRVAILGPGRRSTSLYGLLIKALPEEVQLVGVWGRSPESSRRLGEALAMRLSSREGGRPVQLPLDPDIYVE